jgi:exodeoxyribonuclease V beta subunit
MQPFDWETAPLDRNTLLEASAGTGKTYTLEHLVLRLITEREIPLPSILVVTFTNAAAREMQDRIRGLLLSEARNNQGRKKELLQQAVTDFDSSSIMTIHGFCSRVLQKWPFESGVSLGLEIGSENDLALQSVWDWFRKNDKKNLSPFLIAAYHEAYVLNGDFHSLTVNILNLISGNILKEGGHIYPDENRRILLENLINNWDSSDTRASLNLLAREAREIDSSKTLLSFFNSDEMGEGLGTKRAIDFHEILKISDTSSSFNELLDFLSGSGKSILTRITKILARDTLPRGNVPITKAFLRLVQAYDQEWNKLTPQEIKKSLARLFEFYVAGQVGKELEGTRIRQGVLTFNDLIDVVHQVLGENGRSVLLKAVKKYYRVLLVDEFQDTDQRQWDIFKALFDDRDHNYFLIGDPKQSIYRFRGADLQVYLDVRNKLPSDSLYRLENNYRSHPLLLEGFNTLFPTLFSQNSGEDSIGYSPVGAGKSDVPRLCRGSSYSPPCEFILMETGQENKNSAGAQDLWLRSCANHIVSLLNDSSTSLEGTPLKASDMAVLLESNALCFKLQSMLTSRGVPAVIYEERDIFQSKELEMISLFLSGLVNRDRGESIRRLLLSPLVDLTPSELLYLEDYGFMDSLVLTFRYYRDRVDQGDLIAQFTAFCRLGREIARFLFQGGKIDASRKAYLEEQLMERILRTGDGVRIHTNLRHILEILHEEQQRKRLNSEELSRFIIEEKFRKHAQERFHIRLEREGNAVQIMTLHSSKGLQFPLVYFGGGLKNQLLKNVSTYLDFTLNGERCYDFLKDSDHVQRAVENEWEERKRLYYVAMTRAESKLYLPLYQDWDNFWLSWLYKTFTKTQDHINPYASSAISLEEGSTFKALKEWIRGREHLFRIEEASGEELLLKREGEQETILNEPPALNLNLDHRHPWLYSFSSLTISDHNPGDILAEDASEGADYDDQGENLIPLVYPDQDEEITPENISGGAALGNVIHRIFEEIDFSLGKLDWDSFDSHNEIDALVLESILFYFKRDWAAANSRIVKEMVWNTLNSPLDGLFEGDDFPSSLSALPGFQRLHEKEFLLGVKDKGRVELDGLFHSLKKGYLKGFIDLIFIWKGRYFIADWKTTRCSAGDEDPYCQESVQKIMNEHNYHLQYWIYTAALYLYLTGEGDDFSYKRDFGGVFYFFNRGMTPKRKGKGVFFCRPGEEDLVDFMKKYVEEIHD